MLVLKNAYLCVDRHTVEQAVAGAWAAVAAEAGVAAVCRGLREKEKSAQTDCKRLLSQWQLWWLWGTVQYGQSVS